MKVTVVPHIRVMKIQRTPDRGDRVMRGMAVLAMLVKVDPKIKVMEVPTMRDMEGAETATAPAPSDLGYSETGNAIDLILFDYNKAVNDNGSK